MVEKISLESTALGYSYLISSPSVLKFLRPRYLQEWGEISKSIFSGSWKSNSLASKFLELSPLLLEIISFDDLKKIAEYCKNLSVKSCDLASHNLDWFSENLPILGKESGDFIILLKKMTTSDWREINMFFELLDLNIQKNRVENIKYLNQLLLNFYLEKEKKSCTPNK